MMSLLRILLVICLANVVASREKKEIIGTTKNVYLLCVTLEHFLRKLHLSASLDFAVEFVNNRSDIVPGYNLQMECGFSTESVSLLMCFFLYQCYYAIHLKSINRNNMLNGF